MPRKHYKNVLTCVLKQFCTFKEVWDDPSVFLVVSQACRHHSSGARGSTTVRGHHHLFHPSENSDHPVVRSHAAIHPLIIASLVNWAHTKRWSLSPNISNEDELGGSRLNYGGGILWLHFVLQLNKGISRQIGIFFLICFRLLKNK